MIKKTIFCLLALSFAFVQQNVAQQKTGQLTVLDYNSMHGFTTDSSSRTEYVNWVKQLAPDVVMYQEMIDFPKAELEQFAKQYGHTFMAVMSKETGYDVTHPIVITSKYPMEEVEMKNEGMWHGYVCAKIKGVYCIATHLAPFTLKDRQKDIETILAKVRSLPKNAMVLIGGDFNSLARFDSAQYGDNLLKGMLKLEGRLEPKSGTPIVKNKTIYRNNLNNGQIDYSVTDKMMEANFVDAYFFLHKTFKNSVPVKSQMKKNSILRRTDYVWLNKNLSGKLVAADIIHDSTTDVISDHYPILVKFKLK